MWCASISVVALRCIARKTSDETLRAMKPLVDKDLFAKLSKMLQLADLVKFAKWHTTPDENERV